MNLDFQLGAQKECSWLTFVTALSSIHQMKYELLDSRTTRACRLEVVLGPDFTPSNPSWYYTVWWADLKTRTFKVAVMPTQRIRRRR
jgi:hypothetical protein